MTQDSIAYLTSKIPMWRDYKAVQVIPHLPVEDSKRLLSIAQEIDPRYSGTIWCQSCLEDLVKFVFNNFEQTEDYKQATAEPEKKITKETFTVPRGTKNK